MTESTCPNVCNFKHIPREYKALLYSLKELNKMNWTILLLLASFGLVMGLLSINGYTQKIEPFLWLVFGIVVAFILSRNVNNKPLLHALLIGLFWGVLNGISQSAFFDQYLTNNPNLEERFKQSTFIQPRWLVLITGLVTGLIAGAVIGGLTWLFKRIG